MLRCRLVLWGTLHPGALSEHIGTLLVSQASLTSEHQHHRRRASISISIPICICIVATRQQQDPTTDTALYEHTLLLANHTPPASRLIRSAFTCRTHRGGKHHYCSFSRDSNQGCFHYHHSVSFTPALQPTNHSSLDPLFHDRKEQQVPFSVGTQ